MLRAVGSGAQRKSVLRCQEELTEVGKVSRARSQGIHSFPKLFGFSSCIITLEAEDSKFDLNC